MKFLILLTFVLAGVKQSQANLECAAGANACAEALFNAESTSTSNAETCQAVDIAIDCIANATSGCDPLAAADVASSMSAIIDEYTNPPYNCTLENADNPAFNLDPCSKELSYCSEILYNASISQSYDLTCLLKESYKSCMATNTSSCDTSLQTTIDTTVAEADVTYNKQPYFCIERLSTNMTGCDVGYASCNAALADIGVNAVTTAEVCPLVDAFTPCVSSLDCPASVITYYEEVATNLTTSFKDLPYFCGAENACQKLFDACNDSLSANANDECSLRLVYQACIGNIESLCAVGQLAELNSTIEQINAELAARSPTGCQTTTGQPTGITVLNTSSTIAPVRTSLLTTPPSITPSNITGSARLSSSAPSIIASSNYSSFSGNQFGSTSSSNVNITLLSETSVTGNHSVSSSNSSFSRNHSLNLNTSSSENHTLSNSNSSTSGNKISTTLSSLIQTSSSPNTFFPNSTVSSRNTSSSSLTINNTLPSGYLRHIISTSSTPVQNISSSGSPRHQTTSSSSITNSTLLAKSLSSQNHTLAHNLSSPNSLLTDHIHGTSTTFPNSSTSESHSVPEVSTSVPSQDQPTSPPPLNTNTNYTTSTTLSSSETGGFTNASTVTNPNNSPAQFSVTSTEQTRISETDATKVSSSSPGTSTVEMKVDGTTANETAKSSEAREDNGASSLQLTVSLTITTIICAIFV